MTEQAAKPKSIDELKQEIQRLKGLLQEEQALRQEAQETLEAIRTGAVDGIVRSTPEGEQIFILKGSDTPYRNLIEKMDEGALLISESGSILYANIGFAKLVDAPLDKVMGTHVSKWVSACNIEVLNDILAGNLKNGRIVFEIAFQTTRKQLVPTQVSISKISLDSINVSALIITDLSKHMQEDIKRYTTDLEKEIANRKKAEEALKRSEAEFKTLAENAPDAIMRFDRNLRVLYLNPKDLAATGKRLEEFIGKTNEEMGMPAELCKLWNEMFEKAKTSRQVQHVDFDFNTPTGRKTFSLRIVPEFAKDDSLISYLGISRDITERKKAEEELKNAKENLEEQVQQRTAQLANERKRLFDILETVPIMVCLLTTNFHVAFANRSFREKFGESKGRHCYDYCFGKSEPCEFCESYKVLQTGKPHHWQVNGSDGSVIDAFDFPFTDVDGSKMVLEMDINITEQKRLEKQLKDSERLAAIGATAGMVGHDIRNPLQAITGDVYLAKAELASMANSEEKLSIQESLTEIEKNIDYINKIVQDLQDYARPLNPNPGEVDLKLIIDKLIKKNGIPKNVKVSIGVEDEARRFVADADYLNRILYNLVTNSVQAMPKGGKLSIIAHKEANEVVIAVKDTGIGIPKEIQGKMFTPMFTTKSKGQGFGLPVVKRMTDSLGGKVSFESEEGKGTTFTVRFAPKELKR
jgi:PAS domain S-box-containing protein